MKVLVTGGAGFIGSNIVDRLQREGNEVVVLDNFLSGYRENLIRFPKVTVIEGDVRDAVAVDEAMRGVEVVFHLAASVGNKRSIDYPLDDAEINVLGTLQVLEAAKKRGVRKIVASSSAGIYGELKTIPITEDHPIEPDTPYGCTKLCEEKLCLSYAKLYEIESVCLRYFNVYGPNQRFDAYGNVIPIFVFNALRGDDIVVFGDGEQTRDFVNVADVVQANMNAAMMRGVSGAFNIASGTRVSINKLARMISDEVGTQTTIRFGSPRKGDVRDSLAEIRAARDALGYRPAVELQPGLTEYVSWARKELNRAECE
jgi:UDP-glucose 4-epimerase